MIEFPQHIKQLRFCKFSRKLTGCFPLKFTRIDVICFGDFNDQSVYEPRSYEGDSTSGRRRKTDTANADAAKGKSYTLLYILIKEYKNNMLKMSNNFNCNDNRENIITKCTY